MKTLSRLVMLQVIVGFVILSSGCIVEPAHDDRWCENHPRRCDR